MRVVLLALCAWAALDPIRAAGAARPSTSIQLKGREYVSLAEWAQPRKLDCSWNKRGEEVQLSNRGTKVLLTVDSQRAEFNGVAVFLSFPLAARNGTAYIARSDIEELLVPLLQPAKNRPGQRIKTIALCPGHGGKDPGNQIGGLPEKKYTLLLAKELQRLLTQSGFKVALTRAADNYVGLEERALLAKRKRADLYVSLHYNCANPGNHETRGSEVYCLTPEGAESTNGGTSPSGAPSPGNRNNEKNVLLAYQVQKALVQKLGMADRGVRRARFAVLRYVTMPAVLIEAGFMSAPQDMARIKDSDHRRRTAQAVADALMAYKRLVER